MTELLVVLVIASVLLALIVPATQRMIESSHTAQCAANLRRLGMDVLETIYDNNGTLAWYEYPKSHRGMWWYKVLSRSNFEDFSKKMTCPSIKKPYQYLFSPDGKTPVYGNYRYNKFMGYQDKDGNWVYPLTRISSVSKPGRLAVLADDRTVLADRADDSMGFETWTPILNAHKQETTGVIFCLDGHIELLTKENPNKIEFVPWYLN